MPKRKKRPIVDSAAEYRRESRARIAELASQGKGAVAIAESVALLGIKAWSGTPIQLVGFGGKKLRHPITLGATTATASPQRPQT